MIESIHAVPLVFIISSSLFLFIALFGALFTQKTVQKIEQKIIPSAQELMNQDMPLKLLFAIISLFAIFSYALALISQPEPLLLTIWQATLIISFVCLCAYMQRLFRYTQPHFLLEKIATRCCYFARHHDNSAVFQEIDKMIETAAKATSTTSYCLAIFTLHQITQTIEGCVKAMSLRAVSKGSEEFLLLDIINAFVVYISRRLEWLFEIALQKNMVPIAEEIIAIFGKMSLFFVQYHPSLARLPLIFIEHCSALAFQQNRDEVNVRISTILSELIKNFIITSIEHNQSMKEIILLTLAHLEENIQKSFQKNKTLNPALLMQPFAEIGQLLGQDRFATIIDREEILAALRRILATFNALDQVMQKKQS